MDVAARPSDLPRSFASDRPAPVLHVLAIAAIFAVYFGLMATLMTYMALQVRHRDEPEHDGTHLGDPSEDLRQDEPDGLLAAA